MSLTVAHTQNDTLHNIIRFNAAQTMASKLKQHLSNVGLHKSGRILVARLLYWIGICSGVHTSTCSVCRMSSYMRQNQHMKSITNECVIKQQIDVETELMTFRPRMNGSVKHAKLSPSLFIRNMFYTSPQL